MSGSVADADAIDGIAHPRQRSVLFGHHEAQREFAQALAAGRLHHAWILSGPKGIGKSTLAFRIAKYLAAHPGDEPPPAADDATLAVDPTDRAATRIAAGAHPNVLHLKRPWDDRAKRFKTLLTVDEVRRTLPFFGSTAGEDGWRICIVDALDDANRNAANALLKVLEEPPKRSVFLIVNHIAGRILPTIRSRCRMLHLRALDPADVGRCLADLGVGESADPGELKSAIDYADGSVRDAILLLEHNGVAIYREFDAIIRDMPNAPVAAIHALADKVTRRGADDAYAMFLNCLRGWLARRLHGDKGDAEKSDLANLARTAQVWEKVNRSVASAEILNLDRKQVVLGVFRDLSHGMR
jgi:DNA polymerase-3 subunit delta'